MLTQFTQPAILKGIGHARLAKFFEGRSDELRTANVVLPEPNSDDGDYFKSLAAILRRAMIWRLSVRLLIPSSSLHRARARFIRSTAAQCRSPTGLR